MEYKIWQQEMEMVKGFVWENVAGPGLKVKGG